MKQKSTNRMDTPGKGFGTKTLKLILALVVAGTSLANAQRVVQHEDAAAEQNSFAQEKNTPGTGTPIRNVVVIPFCPTITSLNMLDMGFDKAIVSWTNTLNFDSIYFRVSESGTNIWRTIAISGTPNPGRYFIQGLDPLTDYDIEVSSKCFGQPASPWSSTLTVTTLAQPGPPRIANSNRNTNNMHISPNPATTIANISFMASSNLPQQIMITNSTSQVVYKTTILPNADKVMIPVDVSNFPTGVYFVKVSNTNGVSVERMIVQ